MDEIEEKGKVHRHYMCNDCGHSDTSAPCIMISHECEGDTRPGFCPYNGDLVTWKRLNEVNDD